MEKWKKALKNVIYLQSIREVAFRAGTHKDDLTWEEEREKLLSSKHIKEDVLTAYAHKRGDYTKQDEHMKQMIAQTEKIRENLMTEVSPSRSRPNKMKLLSERQSRDSDSPQSADPRRGRVEMTNRTRKSIELV